MTYVILDLEFNGTYSKKKHHFVNEIIEFGAVKCDEKLNIIDTFSQLVTPQISKKLNTHVSKLTHIKMDELKESKNTFTHVLSEFKKFLGDGVLMSWGNSDVLVLMENCRYYFGEETLSFLSSYCNLQTYCEKALDYHDRARQMGLSTCAQLLGIGFEDDTLHRALTDAELTSLCFQKLYHKELLEEYIDACDEEFYRKITFKNYNIYDLHDPDIDRKEMYFTCEKCGKKALRRSKWRVKNKTFRARFRCLKCKYDFEGRITFKKCYNSVKIIKRAVELPLPEQQQKLTPEQQQSENQNKDVTMKEQNTTEMQQKKKRRRPRHRSKKPQQVQDQQQLQNQQQAPIEKTEQKEQKPKKQGKQPKEQKKEKQQKAPEAARPERKSPVLLIKPGTKPTDEPLEFY